jgi:hypothetical protein
LVCEARSDGLLAATADSGPSGEYESLFIVLSRSWSAVELRAHDEADLIEGCDDLGWLVKRCAKFDVTVPICTSA